MVQCEIVFLRSDELSRTLCVYLNILRLSLLIDDCSHIKWDISAIKALENGESSVYYWRSIGGGIDRLSEILTGCFLCATAYCFY